jgi:hypothetical protein
MFLTIEHSKQPSSIATRIMGEVMNKLSIKQ